MESYSYLVNTGTEYLENLYEQFQKDPSVLDTSWQRFFEGFEFGYQACLSVNGGANGTIKSTEQISKEINVLNLIQAYRSRGHLFAKTNPILPNRKFQPDLSIQNFDLSEADLNLEFQAGTEIGLGKAKLADIIAHLEKTYCGSIGVEYKYIRIPELVRWIEKNVEENKNTPQFSVEKKRQILRKIGQATRFENFLQRRFQGQKRFSLEGSEALIPALDGIIDYGSDLGVQEFVIGMAHRGRLNVLTNIMKKEYDAVFGEFEGKGIADNVFDGDVKYHMGFSSDIVSSSGNNVHLSLVPNPSHLEAVDPVVVGIARAKMDKNYHGDHNKICPILIHGDASLAGQGVIYELIQMSRLPGYEVGGTIHIVINNQIGFTTNPSDSRSSTYCTDIGKVTHSPIFHVNGDDVEALVYVTKLALAFRQRFHRDVFIDIVSYRKYGHNEGDEPRFTQPKMYAAIDKHRDPFYMYSQKLLQENTITAEELKSFEKELDEHLNSELQQAKSTHEYEIDVNLKRNWAGISFYDNDKVEPNPITAVSQELLFQVAEAISKIPATFHPHKKVAEVIYNRAEQVFKTNKIDWGNAEHLALGTLLLENIPVRISGQDVERGTFSHRHAVLIDQEDESKYIPLNHLKHDQAAKLSIYNSLLSEYAVMGFEFGYASAFPNALTIWEAQYGDFFNGAQIIVDQFLTSSKTKWQRMNGLVLLLPHGYEGGGPEHSSARIERFMQQCAQNNMYVCNFTEPANYFHALRRQLLTSYRRPLVVFTPKSLLRHKDCFSTVEEFTQGSFKEVIDDPTAKPADIKRLIFTSGKLYYDLYRYQRELALKEVAIIRIEQYYPFPDAQLSELVKKYKKAKEFIWAQEEPENMGLWNYLLYRWREMADKLQVVSRKEASSTATGSMRQHISQQQFIIKKSLNLPVETEIRI